METDPVRIAAIGTAVPSCVVSQTLAHRLLLEHYRRDLTPRALDILEKLLSHPSIRQRHIAVDSPLALVGLKNEDPDTRIGRFTRWAVDLGEEAINNALISAGVEKARVGALIVNTCTGYICPGLSTYLAERLGLDHDTRLYDLVGSGCGGAIPNMHLGASLAKTLPGRVVVCASIEICSATFQMGNDISLILSNALFGDGAAAVVLWDRPEGVSIHASAGRLVAQCRDDVRYVYRKGQLHNRLSPQLPRIIGEAVTPFTLEFLTGAGLTVGDIACWAVHPGGERMLDTLQEGLGLDARMMSVSRSVLSEYGNMSSPTVLFALQQFLGRGLSSGQWCCMIAYGAGLSMHGLLLRG